MKVLITGGCGFVGTNLAAHALERGDELAVFDNLSRIGSGANLQWLRGRGPFLFVRGDVRNSRDVEKSVRDFMPNVIFHLAGQVAMTTSITNPRLDFEINALGTLNVLETVRLYAPEAMLIYSSTNKVYGDLESVRYEELPTRYIAPDYPEGFDERFPLDFHSPYGCSKGSADQYVLDYARLFGVHSVVLRHSSMYGGRQYATYDQGWIGWFCQKALETKRGRSQGSFTISGNGKQVRDVLNVEDVVDLYFLLAQNMTFVRGQAFNIGGGMANCLSLLELFSFLEREVDVHLLCTQLPPRQSDQKVFVADMRKLKHSLGWEPKIRYTEGIHRMLQWTEGLQRIDPS